MKEWIFDINNMRNNCDVNANLQPDEPAPKLPKNSKITNLDELS